jgi:hypothetical protein
METSNAPMQNLSNLCTNTILLCPVWIYKQIVKGCVVLGGKMKACLSYRQQKYISLSLEACTTISRQINNIEYLLKLTILIQVWSWWFQNHTWHSLKPSKRTWSV